MSTLKFGSAGVTAEEIDVSGPVVQQPTGVPAGAIGTSMKGQAFVPITVGAFSDWVAKFGPGDGKKFLPLAANEWLRNQSAFTTVRVLGVGDGKDRLADGSVNEAGFTVGEKQPDSSGLLASNPYANAGGPPGRTYFLGAFMSASAGSTIFSDAGVQPTSTAVPVVRGILMAASGVILRLANDLENVPASYTPPAGTAAATEANSNGLNLGTTTLYESGVAKSEFRLFLNGHGDSDPSNPTVISASFDVNAPNYFANVFNTDPYALQQTGHYLYANFDVLDALAVVTGSGLLNTGSYTGTYRSESSAFLVTGSNAYNVGTSTAPNYEAFTDRFSSAKSPWVVSQHFGGVATNLFRLHALDDGNGISTLYKISVENIASSNDNTNPFGTFDVVVRDWNDTDGNARVLEQWRGLSLNPNDSRYVSKVIGDVNAFFDFDRADSEQKLAIDGEYENASNLVRVEVSDDVQNGTIDPTALPFGFRGPAHLVTSGSAPLAPVSSSQLVTNLTTINNAKQLPLPLRSNISNGTGNKVLVNPQLYWGVQFEQPASLSLLNGSTLQNKSLNSWAKYYPQFSTYQTFVAGDNAGEPDTAANGIIDSDRFCNNMFSLERVSIVTGSAGTADPSQWALAQYVRDGRAPASGTTRFVTIDDFTQPNRRFLKFTMFMQGGFDGTNIFNRDEAELNNNAVTADMNDPNRGRNNGPNVMAYKKALQLMASTTDVDVQLLVAPGIRNPAVTDTLITSVEQRFDALALVDIEQLDANGDEVTGDSQMPVVNATADNFAARSIDSSFAAAYFPDVIMVDPSTKTNIVAPPSVAVLGAIALNDKLAQPWFAPAGMTRGSLQTTLEARVKLSKPNMDILYDVNINPLVAFPGNSTGGTAPTSGVVVWGQKTLQQSASALDRVNVRRLLINVRRQIRDIAQTFVFEPSREATLARFQQAVTPILQRVQKLSGVDRYKVVIDTTTTTQADILNSTLRGKVYLVPTRSIEYVSLDFVVSNPGATA